MGEPVGLLELRGDRRGRGRFRSVCVRLAPELEIEPVVFLEEGLLHRTCREVALGEVETTAGVSLAGGGAKKLWQNDSIHYQQARCTSVAKDGFAYLDSRITGFSTLDMKSGKLLGQHPHIYHMSQGSHNWTWHIATNDRVLTSGVLMFSDGDLEVHDADGDMNGVEGLLDILKSQGYPASPLRSEAVEEALLKYSNAIRLDDDVTFVEIRFRP